jgi:glycosyltransferase involved in cell wall biosynthesis
VTKVLLNACALIATRVLVNGKALADDLLPQLRRRTTDIVLSSLSEGDISPPTEPDTEDVDLLCVCRLVSSKRVDIVIDATHLLLEGGLNVHLVVVGDGPLMNDLLGRVDSLGLQDCVRLSGWIGDREVLRDVYATADFFLLATEAEGISLAILEAMAAGIPVISTAAGGLRDFLVDGENAVVIEEPSSVAFAAAVRRLLKDSGTYMNLARNAQKKIASLTNQTWVHEFHDLVMKDLG